MTWLLAIRGFLKAVPWQVWAVVAIIAACGLSYCAGERTGRADERALWEAEVAEIRADRDKAMSRAAELDELLAASTDASIIERRKELDDATEELPDQGLSARQCARARQQLQREGRGRELSPACAAILSDGTD